VRRVNSAGSAGVVCNEYVCSASNKSMRYAARYRYRHASYIERCSALRGNVRRSKMVKAVSAAGWNAVAGSAVACGARARRAVRQQRAGRQCLRGLPPSSSALCAVDHVLPATRLLCSVGRSTTAVRRCVRASSVPACFGTGRCVRVPTTRTPAGQAGVAWYGRPPSALVLFIAASHFYRLRFPYSWGSARVVVASAAGGGGVGNRCCLHIVPPNAPEARRCPSCADVTAHRAETCAQRFQHKEPCSHSPTAPRT